MGENGRAAGAAGGAVGLSGFAAALGLCCTVPWAVALFGVTGAVAFARLAFLLPYAVIGSALMLGAAFWFAYRPVAGGAGGGCRPGKRKALRWIVGFAALLVGTLWAVALVPMLTYR